MWWEETVAPVLRECFVLHEDRLFQILILLNICLLVAIFNDEPDITQVYVGVRYYALIS